jgi:S-methylmethionine-dependent homocysteine/selenocysteine methylase
VKANGPLPSGRPLILDGATGTELDRAGVNVSLPLWSARAIDDAPDVLRGIHEQYLRAGADIITTCTFRSTARTLRHAGLADAEERAAAMTRRAVEIARAARDAVNPEAVVAGGIASLEECYEPSLAPDEETAFAEHAVQVEQMIDAGADVILFETMGTVREAAGAARAGRDRATGRWMISFCTLATGAAGRLISEEPIEDALAYLDGAVGIGVNCVAAPRVAAEVAHLRALDAERDVLAYANVGHADPTGLWVSTDAIEPRRYADYAADWLAAGATVIGGCCGTTPATIEAIRGRGDP